MAGLKFAWRLATSLIGRHQSPGQTEVQRQVLGYAPIVFNERAVQFPAAAGNVAIERLIVDGQARQALQKIRHRLAAPQAGKDPVSVLETLGQDVHLIGANGAADLNVVVAANHVERIGDGENIGPALKRRESAIAQRPVTAIQLGRCQTAADASQIGARNAERLRLRSYPCLAT